MMIRAPDVVSAFFVVVLSAIVPDAVRASKSLMHLLFHSYIGT